ncbi:MAG: TatD family hydrolase [Succinivibrio sp.]|nr:TatD family hydrolase [Succinivibrio sp.]
MLIDAHVHPSLFAKPAEVYLQAEAAGILLLSMSCDVEDGQRVRELSAQFKTPAFVGIHPWYAKSAELPLGFTDLLEQPNLLGIGECGLDPESPLELKSQLELLETQLDLAAQHRLMVSLHVRKRHGELIALLKKYRGRLRGMVHNFTFSKDLARSYLDLNFKLSVGSHLLQRTPKMCEVLRFAGAGALLLETDSDGIHSGPYSTGLVRLEYETLAELLGLELNPLIEQLWNNFQSLRMR